VADELTKFLLKIDQVEQTLGGGGEEHDEQIDVAIRPEVAAQCRPEQR
jgi:hypothetical protein